MVSGLEYESAQKLRTTKWTPNICFECLFVLKCFYNQWGSELMSDIRLDYLVTQLVAVFSELG